MDDIARFGVYLSDEKHSSRNTVSSYLRDTTQFAEYLHNYCDIDLREADSAAVQDYMDWMLSHGKSAASVTRFLASVKSFYSYMVAAGELKRTRHREWPPPKWSGNTRRSSPPKRWSYFWNSRSAWTPRASGITPCWSCCTPPASGSAS